MKIFKEKFSLNCNYYLSYDRDKEAYENPTDIPRKSHGKSKVPMKIKLQ